MTITEEKINANFLLWINKLKQYDCYSEEMINDLGDKIKNASFMLNNAADAAYQGSMLNVVLNNLCLIACHINEMALGGQNPKTNKAYHPNLYVDKNSLMKVLLLQHISKCEMFVPERNDWKIKNGNFYAFNENLVCPLKGGERSILICMKYGIKLTEEEFDAIRIIDKEDNEKNNMYITPLSLVVKLANQLTSVELYRKSINK